jgi:hypothetical protein
VKLNDPLGLGGVKNANLVLSQLKPNFNSWLPFTQLSAWPISIRLFTFATLPLLSPRPVVPEMLTVVKPGAPPALAPGIPSCSARIPWGRVLAAVAPEDSRFLRAVIHVQVALSMLLMRAPLYR